MKLHAILLTGTIFAFASISPMQSVPAAGTYGLKRNHVTIAQCRATEGARIAAGLCGAHGCDCGMTAKECKAARPEIQRCIEKGSDSQGMVCFRLVASCIKG